jgi:hypothetical protein
MTDKARAPENTESRFSGDQNICPVTRLQKLTPDPVYRRLVNTELVQISCGLS